MKSRIKGIPKDEIILFEGSCADAIWAGTSRYTVWNIVLTNKSIWKQKRKEHWYSRTEAPVSLPYTLVKQVEVVPNGRSYLVSINFNMPFQPIPFDVYFYGSEWNAKDTIRDLRDFYRKEQEEKVGHLIDWDAPPPKI